MTMKLKYGEKRQEGSGQSEEERERPMQIKQRAPDIEGLPSPSFPRQSLAGLSPVTAVLLTHQLAEINKLPQLPSLQGPSQQSPG